ncbi:hypothetical protein LJB85_01110 [Porphyromonadaceae bacterium OttesenSCG-928-L07]|nr:hypothetical protein [Porphyromonadaceae bacterium OttesenSCG-928-L07]MDL2252263.1 hypothetical protein [Odoribacter sp. OttesenSCG-928-J03]
MEDYIKREIDKIGKIVEAVLVKLGVLKKSGETASLYGIAKTELLEGLNIDLDTLLESENFIDILVHEHHFNSDHLEKFAELLFDFLIAAEDKTTQTGLVSNINSIYQYLEKNEMAISLNRYYILKELEKYV